MSGAFGYITQIEPSWVEIKEVHLPLRRLAPAFAGLRLVQLSDIHLGGWLKRHQLDYAVNLMIGLKPDIILLTGDYLPGHGWVPSHADYLKDLEAGLKPLAAVAPVLAILGNHDHWSNPSAVRVMLAQAGALDLSNTVYTYNRDGDRLHIGGVDSIYAGMDRLDQVLAQLPETGAAILLAHEPDFADTSAATGRFDLQISGHSHGGQVIIPFVGPIELPKYAEKYPLGLYRVGNMYQYTNRGLGMASIPVRFNCRPEISLFVLESGQTLEAS